MKYKLQQQMNHHLLPRGSCHQWLRPLYACFPFLVFLLILTACLENPGFCSCCWIFKKGFICFMRMSILLTFMSVYHVYPELELWTVVNCSIGAGNQTGVFCKDKCPEPGPGWPHTDPPTSDSRLLGLKACSTTAWLE